MNKVKTMNPRNDSIYPISVVMNMTNLTARQIRYYETHGLIKPARSKGNQRLYTPADVENLLLIKSLLDKGLNLDGIKAIMNGPKPVESVSTTPTSPAAPIFNPQRPGVPKLTSLYPVNNQEALNDLLKNKHK
ncbi:MAG TPA: MerR family transcriptional regulator [Bacillota bacterium]|nr:MerR family transcriptional regulator [Bacillota bacterium]